MRTSASPTTVRQPSLDSQTRVRGRMLPAPWDAAVGLLAVGMTTGVIAWWTGGEWGITQATLWLVFGLFAISIDLLWGYCGLLSFGQAAFFGLGAFVYTWLTTDTIGLNLGGAGTVLGLFAAALVTALAALSLGYFLFYGRVVGAFFTIVTLAFSFLMQSLGQGLPNAFGGFTGIPGVPPLIGLGSPAAKYLFCLGVATAIALLVRWLTVTPFGLVVAGVKDNEDRAGFLGHRTLFAKLVVFSLASAIAGLAGALYASQANYVASDLLGTILSTEAVVWVAVGGRRTIVGAFAGAVIVRGVGYWLSGIAVEWWQVLLGALFLVLVMGGSSGLSQLAVWSWRRGVARVARNA